MKKISLALIFMLSIVVPSAHSVTNEDIMNRLDEMQFESDLKEIQRQGNKPYDDHASLFRDRELLYMGKEMGADYFIHLPISYDKKWNTYTALIVTSSNNPRVVENRVYLSSFLGASIYCDFPGMVALTATFYSKPGMMGDIVYEAPKSIRFNEDFMRRRPIFAKMRSYVCNGRK